MALEANELVNQYSWLGDKPALELSAAWQYGMLAAQAILCLLTIIYAIHVWKKTSNRSYLYIWLGGFFSIFYEPLGDLLAHVTYHEVNQINFITSFGFEIPIWMAPAYPVAVSASIIWNIRRIEAGVDMKSWMSGFFYLIPALILFELPMIALGYVEYWEPRAFSILGYPLVMAFVNTAGLIFINATVIHLIMKHGAIGKWPILLVVLVPMVTAGSHLAVSLPWGYANNATANVTMINIGALLSIASSVIATWICGNAICRDRASRS